MDEKKYLEREYLSKRDTPSLLASYKRIVSEYSTAVLMLLGLLEEQTPSVEEVADQQNYLNILLDIKTKVRDKLGLEGGYTATTQYSMPGSYLKPGGRLVGEPAKAYAEAKSWVRTCSFEGNITRYEIGVYLLCHQRLYAKA